MCWVNTLISTSPPPPLTLMTDEGIQGYIGIQLYYKSIEGFGKPRHLTCFFPSHRKFRITLYRKFARLCAEIQTIFLFCRGPPAGSRPHQPPLPLPLPLPGLVLLIHPLPAQE